MLDWTATASAVSASLLASFVEAVEAFTIVLAVAAMRGWRPALIGAFAGLAVLAALVLALGPLISLAPLFALQFVIGILLLLFGMRWLRKAILRSGGVIALHDEDAAFENETRTLRAEAEQRETRADALAMAGSFKAVLLEGVEIVFIILSVGGGRGLIAAASLGALAACALVVLIGALIHKPLSQIPENALKFVVGAMLSAFGVFWLGESFGIAWPWADWTILALALGFLAAGMTTSAAIRQASAGRGAAA